MHCQHKELVGDEPGEYDVNDNGLKCHFRDPWAESCLQRDVSVADLASCRQLVASLFL